MAKLTSIQGQATGKVGAIVYSVSAGQQIARQYQPNVANPSTTAQVSNRSNFKLASQLAASMFQAIAIPKEGLTSSRNLFVKVNMPLITNASDTSSVRLSGLQLTKSSFPIGSVQANRGEGDAVTLSITRSSGLSRVIYSIFRLVHNDELQLFNTQTIEATGSTGTFDAQVSLSASSDYVIYAYGITDLNARATATFANASVDIRNNIASLISSRSVSPSDYRLTKTAGVILASA
ncbi:MAG: hypothetical protein IIW75_06775 [Bacteroidaceae bacterium]|nr:hypothetical protein [Bacteroidaceae bacterium]